MEHFDGAISEERPGCLLPRLPGMILRLVLVYPVMSMSSQLGRWVQMALGTGDIGGTPYEGALLGMALGLLVGLGLWRQAIAREAWRSDIAQLALALLTAVWLVAAALSVGAIISPEEALIAYAAALVAGAAALALMQ